MHVSFRQIMMMLLIILTNVVIFVPPKNKMMRKLPSFRDFVTTTAVGHHDLSNSDWSAVTDPCL